MISKEYVQLKDTTTGDRLDFLPCKEFTLPNGEFVNLNYAQIDADGEKIIFKPGQIIANTVDEKPTFKSKSDVKEFLIENGVTFPSKATLEKLKELAYAIL